MNRLIRSWLYCPAHQLDIVHKAAASRADAIVIDLEDAVPPSAKMLGRANLAAALAGASALQRWVRVNSADSPWGQADLDVVKEVRPDGIRLAKCESVATVQRIAETVGLPLALIIETPLGMERAFELASAHPLVTGISLGEADLRSNLRVDSDDGLTWARGRIVNAARAAGLPSPAQSVYTRVADLEGLRSSTETARAAGFFGRSVIHPKQVDIVNDVFTPTDEDVASAQHIVDLLANAYRLEKSALLDESGAFIDPAVADRAAFIVQLHHQLHKIVEMEDR
ncbi:MAG: citrate lyase beta subunit [Subtercola sp.]|nr:citrate lyase beta subunit [Subtercola sp.]